MLKRNWNWTNNALALVTLILAALALSRGGGASLTVGFLNGFQTFLHVLPLLIAAFLIAGLTQVLVSDEMIHRWLGAQAGWRSIMIASLGGALIPGGPYVYYPITAVLLQKGASLGVLVAFVTAKNLWAFSRLPLEFALLGEKLTLIRFGLTFILPPLLGFISEALLGQFLPKIRRAVQ